MGKFGRICVAELIIVASCLLATSYCEGPSDTGTPSNTAPKEQSNGSGFGYIDMALSPLGLQSPRLRAHQTQVAGRMIANGVGSVKQALSFRKQESTQDKPS
ncbi:hypothetical protein DdX_10164 [Ditylenchus destructor]|uniref:Secreted protein n=1 Tax=Ditylenchus destructor TaxID=166010 RepID=A0AAD4R5C9_9BILA|nr:hypothetical protein DdX_10164 [Ditylenchus destructor]